MYFLVLLCTGCVVVTEVLDNYSQNFKTVTSARETFNEREMTRVLWNAASIIIERSPADVQSFGKPYRIFPEKLLKSQGI